MGEYDIYHEIETRTNGDIYIGVVGPVRTGKSTFIRHFIEALVLPNMKDVNDANRTRDELPQASAGKTIMTTEPKFVPQEAVKLDMGEDVHANVRLIDCVGYMVEGANGYMEEEKERLVKTPWFAYEIPFSKAAEIGTQKVINDHSTIGIIVSCDGSFGELPREAYIPAESRTVEELKGLHKPFVLVMNTQRPHSTETKELCQRLATRYGVNVVPVNCEQMKKEDITHIMGQVLEEFPVTGIHFKIPKWVEILSSDSDIKQSCVALASEMLNQVFTMKDGKNDFSTKYPDCMEKVVLVEENYGTGVITYEMTLKQKYYYETISQYAGIAIQNEAELMSTLLTLSKEKETYEKVRGGLETVAFSGYGVVMPKREEIQLDAPQIMKHGSKFGVKMKAVAPCIHFIRSDIETEIAPIVGTEEQAKDLVAYIEKSAQISPDGIWETTIFGKSIEQIVEDGMSTKISQMTKECQEKLQDTLKKIVNDSKGGVVCIII